MHCSVPFFYPTLFFGCGRVRFFRTSIRSHHHELYKKPSKSSHSLAHYVRPSLHSLTHSCTCPAHKKTTLRGKNIRQPCVFNVGSQRPHYATLRSGFLYLPPSLHSQRLAFIQAYAFTHTRWLKAELPVLFCIVFINENTAKIMCLLCFAKVKPSVFVIISTLQVVLSKKNLTKQQATIVLLLSFAFIPSIFNLIRSGVRTFKK